MTTQPLDVCVASPRPCDSECPSPFSLLRAMALKSKDTNLPMPFEFPAPGCVRMRNLVHRGAPRPVTVLNSLTLNRTVQCESILEIELSQLLDACPSAHSFGEQPLKIIYEGAGGMRWHVPDFVVETKGASEIIEVKFQHDVTPEVLERTERMQSLLQTYGIGYRLVTETYIRSGVLLENAQRLLRRGRQSVSPAWSLQVHHALQKYGALPLEYFGWGRSGHPEAGWIAREIMDGRVHVDLQRLLGADTAVSVSSRLSKENTLWQ